MAKLRVGILTGGGDAPGLNAVIYGALLRAHKEGNIEVVGVKKGWEAFTIKNENLTPDVVTKYTEILNINELDDLHTKGGTIIYSSRSNPYKALANIANKKEREEKGIEIAIDMASKFDILGIDALIAVGGDDTCGVAATMYQHANAKICACPKTIDNDLAGTDFTFGFLSAAQLATDTLDNITTTAHSHQRIFIVEIMGRDAGWLTLYSGLASGSDIILLPETPFDYQKDIANVLKERVNSGYKYHIIACSEGAIPTDNSLITDFPEITEDIIDALPKDVFGNPKLSKLKISSIIEKKLKKDNSLESFFKECDSAFEVRSVILGHTMRAGSPNVFDRILGLRYGYHAMKYIIDGNYGKMSSLQGAEIVPVDLINASKKSVIDPSSDLIEIKNIMVDVKHNAKEKLFDK